MHPVDHARSSAALFGGRMEEYMPLHHWMDATKASIAHVSHRALRHHVEGLGVLCGRFGETLQTSAGPVSVLALGEQHLREDVTRAELPRATDWLQEMEPPSFMPAAIPDAQTMADISIRRWGGQPADYLALHQWFLATAVWHADLRHLALRHHAWGIFEAEEVFGYELVLGNGRTIPTRVVAERHVRDLLRTIPTAADWLRRLKPRSWMVPSPGQKTSYS